MTPTELFNLFLDMSIRAVTYECHCSDGMCLFCEGEKTLIGEVSFDDQYNLTKTHVPCEHCNVTGVCPHCHGTLTCIPEEGSPQVISCVLGMVISCCVGMFRRNAFDSAFELIGVAHVWNLKISTTTDISEENIAKVERAMAESYKAFGERKRPKISPLTEEQLRDILGDDHD